MKVVSYQDTASTSQKHYKHMDASPCQYNGIHAYIKCEYMYALENTCLNISYDKQQTCVYPHERRYMYDKQQTCILYIISTYPNTRYPHTSVHVKFT